MAVPSERNSGFEIIKENTYDSLPPLIPNEKESTYGFPESIQEKDII